MTPTLFDRALIARNLARRPVDHENFLIPLLHADLADRLLTVKRDVSRALAIGPDLSLLPEAGRTAGSAFDFTRVNSLEGPEAPPGAGYDLVVSLMDLQIVEDVPLYLAGLARRLVPDGLLLAAAIGGESLTELRRAFLVAEAEREGGAHARIAPFIALRDGGSLLQRAGLALPVADIETHVVRYPSPLALMAEIKALGASNPLADRPARMATRGLLAAADSAYRDIAGDADGRVRATLEILWLSGWAPHESQQKPLRPGSAETSLKKALGDKSA